ncbi:Tfx family DNA-binding protein [Methanococcus voltae]|uniref:Tfx family DNA-binding protein n=1 Tax=Methanococcus voltae TaxID=2188 RepID=UPI001AE17E33|nr:Tfx family DNA-binding protein [Methanococcus voltae]MBP2144312.1 Tfx family DNA-binding protein [Methanococcus voltae]
MESFLTDVQVKVLDLRKKGHTQDEIAKKMGTSRANISMIEKRAKENVEKARNTLSIYSDIIAPSRIIIPEGTDVFEIPKIVFSKSDEDEIHVRYTSLEIMEFINQNAKKYIRNRFVKEPFIVTIMQTGEIYITSIDSESNTDENNMLK